MDWLGEREEVAGLHNQMHAGAGRVTMKGMGQESSEEGTGYSLGNMWILGGLRNVQGEMTSGRLDTWIWISEKTWGLEMYIWESHLWMVTEAVMVSMEEIAEGGKAEWEEEGARTEQREGERGT